MPTISRFDVLIIGSGAAGMSLALQLPPQLKVAVLSKTQLGSGSTLWAQGGMAAVLHDRDSVQAHVTDTLAAGAGLCHEPAVQFTVGRSRQIVDWLVSQGMHFDLREDQQDAEFREFHLTTEGGHSHRRVIHAADQTGRALSEVLASRVAEASNITLLTDRCLVDVIKTGPRVCGAYLSEHGAQSGRHRECRCGGAGDRGVPARPTDIRPTPTALAETVSRWRGARAAGLPTSNLINFTPPAFITPIANHF